MDSRIERFLTASDELAALIGELRRSTSAGYRGRRAMDEAVAYTRSLLAHLVASSGGVSGMEIELLQHYHLDDLELQETDYVSDTVAGSRGFLDTVPEFLAEAAAAGAATGGIARQMLTAITTMCDAVVAVDNVVEPREAASVSEYLDRLAAATNTATRE